MTYKEKRKQAREINEVKESARLIYMGVQKLSSKNDEEQNERFIASCGNAKIFASDLMKQPQYSFQPDEIAAIEHYSLENLDDCIQFADQLTAVSKNLESQAKIPRLFYPFLPTSVSTWSFTSLEVLLFFVLGIGLYILL